jgi:hypothetical protein
MRGFARPASAVFDQAVSVVMRSSVILLSARQPGVAPAATGDSSAILTLNGGCSEWQIGADRAFFDAEATHPYSAAARP